MRKIIFFDCDSTLSKIEGVDELARLRGATCVKQVEALTNQAMDGEIKIDEIFKKRLNLIKPDTDMVEKVASLYTEEIVDGVEDEIEKLRDTGWEVAIISGGFLPCIEPFAEALGIEKVFAVDLHFNEKNEYTGFDEESPTAKSGGKKEVIKEVLELRNYHSSVMIGDGVSDLEAKGLVSRMIGFGGVVKRDKVVEKADDYIEDISDLFDLLSDL